MNNRFQFKNRLRNRDKIFGAWTSIPHPSNTEIMVRSGVDFVGIDIEHATTSQEQSKQIISITQANNKVCLPRIASHNMEMIKRLLDSGADGLIVPMVSTSEQVENLIRWSKYPPLGRRSFGVARAQGYGFDFDKYVQFWNKSSSLIIQIESQEGVENIDELLNFDDVDGVMIGPYDLSGSLNIPGQLDHPKVIEATDIVIAACNKNGKACGIHVVDPDRDNVKDAFNRGYTFVVLASDVFIFWKWSERINSIIKMQKEGE